jgi:hypothetical protein
MFTQSQRVSPPLLAILIIILLFSGLAPVAQAASTEAGTIGSSSDPQSVSWAGQFYAVQPLPDITKMDYSPIGFFKPGDPIPSPLNPPTDPNPSGKWVAYDVNVFETLNYPSRHPGDISANDPPGSGDPRHGFCPPGDPTFTPWGVCNNHQLEYLDYFERTMTEILGEFGVVIHRYPFISPGTGSRGGYLDAAGGQAYNIAAIVPGADHPDETVLVSGHYDFTDSGPAAGWDSSEGHATVIRIAKIMADHWRATGTRPSATIKFIPWDSEESGTWGSIDYVRNNIPPGEEHKVRAYFNMDPCAGAYPAFRNGNGVDRVPEVLQLADPNDYPAGPVRDRIVAFNARAQTIVDEVFDHLDDEIQTPLGPQPIFVSDAEAAAMGIDSQRDEIVTALGGLAIFSSDYANFAAVGIPIFNLFPDYFGPHADGTPASAEGITILHTPRDNLTTINALTSADPTGLTASEGWAKGLEMCAHIEGWYMLQPEMGGAQAANTDVVAYYEALPNEAIQNQLVTFDASGSYQYADVANRSLVDDSSLTYSWDFGDGTTSTGRTVQHAYPEIGRYTTRLTVRGLNGATDSMTLPVVVVGSNFAPPVLDAIPVEDAADGNFTLTWDFTATRDGFSHFRVEESTDVMGLFSDDAEGGLSERWSATVEPQPADPRLQPWQASDSSTIKFRGNQSRSGVRSFWTGLSPADFNPGVQNARSILTLKDPLSVPSQGDPELSFFSLFQSEGDDQGRVEVAIDDGDTTTEPDWQPVDVTQATMTALGQQDPAICDPSNPDTVNQDFENRRVSLAAYRGKLILLRFVYLLGPDNRAASQPCGWYVDDVRVQSGTFQPIGTTTQETFPVTSRPNGTYAYRIIGVYTDGVATAPSNTETAQVTQASQPDLRVTNITTSNNKPPREGEKVTIIATIANVGNADAGASQTEFLLDGTTVLGVVDTAAIPQGSSTQVSLNWDTRNVKGEHTLRVIADRTGLVSESNEANNAAILTVTVKGNKVQNGSFEQANDSGTGPANWTSSDSKAGTTQWSDGGSDGAKSASVSGNGGNALLAGSPRWTSDPVAVSAGETLSLVVSIRSTGASSAATAGLTYLGAAGQVLDTVTHLTAPLTTQGFVTLETPVTIPAGVTQVRIVLTGFAPTDTHTAGTLTFDAVGLFEP